MKNASKRKDTTETSFGVASSSDSSRNDPVYNETSEAENGTDEDADDDASEDDDQIGRLVKSCKSRTMLNTK